MANDVGMLPGSFQILGQEYLGNEYCFHKALRQAKLSIIISIKFPKTFKKSLCTREKAGKKSASSLVEGASCFSNKREGLSHDH